MMLSISTRGMFGREGVDAVARGFRSTGIAGVSMSISMSMSMSTLIESIQGGQGGEEEGTDARGVRGKYVCS